MNQENKLKTLIKNAIEGNNINKARVLINEYSKLANIDIEYFSLLSIIEILEGDFLKAKETIKTGLEISPDNYDLLFNMNYLMKNILSDNYEEKRYYLWSKLFNISLEVENPFKGTENKKVDIKKSNILHGTIEIANQMNTLTKGLSNQGLNAKALNYYPSYLKYKADYEIDLHSGVDYTSANVVSKKLASRFIQDNDIFHFHFGTTLTLDYSDLPILNDLGKKTVMQHWGSEVRQYSKAKVFSKNVKVKEINEEIIKYRMDLISKYIKHCIVSDYELYEYVKDFYEDIYLLPPVVDLNIFKMKKNDRTKNKLLIVHAPTNRDIKGTEYIIKAIDELSLLYDFDFKLIENMSYEEAMATYNKADIVIDQLLIGSYGLVSIENMALGKPVICYINEYMQDKYPSDLPIISADIYDIKSKLQYLIANRDCLHDIGMKSRLYVEKYHNLEIATNDLVNIYKKL